MQPTKKGAPSCGLYIKIRKSGKSFALIEQLKKICMGINASDYEKNMHVFEYTGRINPQDKEYIEAVQGYLQAQGMVFIIRDDIKFAKKIKADGVIVKTFAEAEEAREKLGEDKIIGIRLPVSKAKLEQALEEHVDYVAMAITQKNQDKILNFIPWWKVRSDSPFLVEGNITNNDCRYLVQSGATFIDCGNYIFKHPAGVLQAVVNMLYAIDVATEK